MQKKTELTEFLLAQNLRVGVEAVKDGLVHKRVLVLGPGALLVLGLRGADDGLDFIAVDQASNIGVADLSGGEA